MGKHINRNRNFEHKQLIVNEIPVGRIEVAQIKRLILLNEIIYLITV